jgi:hypothetical protein
LGEKLEFVYSTLYEKKMKVIGKRWMKYTVFGVE